MRNSELVNHQS